MTYRQFDVPDDVEFVDVFGVEPEKAEATEPSMRKVTFPSNGEDLLTLTFDSAGRSISLHLRRGQLLLLDLFREGAKRLMIDSRGSVKFVVIEFDSDELKGSLTVQILPTISIKDQLLIV